MSGDAHRVSPRDIQRNFGREALLANRTRQSQAQKSQKRLTTVQERRNDADAERFTIRRLEEEAASNDEDFDESAMIEFAERDGL